MSEPLADRTIADLIVSLRVTEEMPSGQRARGAAVAPITLDRVDPVELVSALQAADHIVPAGVIGVVALLLTRQRDVDAVMEVVAPDGVESVPAAVR
jgi:hypothetical protein